MTISQFIKRSTLKAVILSLASFSSLAMITTESHAAQIDFNSWQSFGDVTTPGAGQANLSNNALNDDDFPQVDEIFNFSGTPAGEAAPFPDLQDFLEVADTTLDIDGFAFEGSAIKSTLTAQAGDVFRFSYNFFTNETAYNEPQNDFAFFLVNNSVTKLADFSNASDPSTLFDTETGVQSFSYTFSAPGNYNLALGIVDVNDSVVSSALRVSDANLEPVPEPFTILGSLTAFGFGVGLRRRYRKKA
jgi:hypothetical protein